MDWKTFASVNRVSLCNFNECVAELTQFSALKTAISQMCATAIANMQQAAQKKGKVKYLFSKDEEIIPYMEQYWEAMTTMPRRVTQSWYVCLISFSIFDTKP